MVFALTPVSRGGYRLGMLKELAQNLVEKANLTEEQAQKATEAVRGFLDEKLPEAVKGPVLGFLTAERVEGAVEKVREVAAKLTETIGGESKDSSSKPS